MDSKELTSIRVKRLVALICVLVSPLVSIERGLAEPPEAIVHQAIERMKIEKHIFPLVEYVDWEVQYTQMHPAERTSKAASSAKELKGYFQSKAESFGKEYLKHVPELVDLPADGSAPGQRETLLVQSEITEQLKKLRSYIQETAYEVRPAKVDGASAEVSVIKTFRQESTGVTVKLRLAGDRWLMESAAPLDPRPQLGLMPSPIGGLPQPLSVITRW